MHAECLVKTPTCTEIYACMIHVHKMASRIECIVRMRRLGKSESYEAAIKAEISVRVGKLKAIDKRREHSASLRSR